MSHPFVVLQKASPEYDLGPELGIFDGRGILAASYRTVLGAAHCWIYRKHDANLDQFLILKDENLARLVCEQVATDRGWEPEQSDPPDIDAMYRNLLQ